MCLQTGMLKRLVFPKFLALERLLKIEQDYAAHDARVASEPTMCPRNHWAGAGRCTYTQFLFSLEMEIFHQSHQRKVCEVTFTVSAAALPRCCK